MSRIQDILSKAERDGTARRTRPLTEEYAARPAQEDARSRAGADDAIQARSLVERAPRTGAPASESVRPPALVPEARALPPLAPDAARVLRAPRPEPAPSAIPEGRLRYTDAPYGAATVAPPALDLPIEELPSSAGHLDPLLVAALAPTSLAAEQYRSLRTRLKRAESGRGLRVIAITSPSKGDGKSLTAANLSLTMAQEFQQRVLLIDADLRRPTVHQLFGLQEGPGLTEVLLNVAELDHALVTIPEHHLTVLPAGVPPGNPAELLGSAAMRRVLDTLRTRFDRILVDVPPVAPLADLHILAPMLDGLLMIVRAGVTAKPAIERALAGLDASKVLGLVLNEAGGESSEAYTYEGYGYTAG